VALETVRILVQDDQVVPQPVDDVVVRVYDAAGITLITSGTTGTVDPGIVEVTLEGDTVPTEYQLRFFINGGSIVSPRLIAVYSPASLAPTSANNFAVPAVMFVMPQAINPNLCRVSGYVKGPNGQPRKGIDIHFIPLFNPLLVGDDTVLGERVAVRTDATGFVSVDLYRNGRYEATVESHENIQRAVVVPDRASVNMGDLLFPVVASVVYSEDPLEVDAGEALDVTVVVTASNYQVLTGPAADDVCYSVDDPSVASVEVLSDRIIIHGIATGTTTLQAARRDTSIVHSPDPGIGGGAVSVTVI
jgi:hypothetical protein